MAQIELSGHRLCYDVTRHPRAKRATVRVDPEGVRVTLPKRATPSEADRVLRRHAAWVLRQVEASRRNAAMARRELGIEPGIMLLRGQLVAERPVPWLKKEARKDLIASVERARPAARKQATKVTVRDQRTRWGSCSSLGTLSFNWRLVMAPPAVLDYLVVHELVHLDVPNHSQQFWRQVERHCPRYREHEVWLKRFGGTLLRWKPSAGLP